MPARLAMEETIPRKSNARLNMQTDDPPIYLVLCAFDYEGDTVEMVTHDCAKALALRDRLNAKKRPQQNFRVEEWQDGGLEGKEIS